MQSNILFGLQEIFKNKYYKPDLNILHKIAVCRNLDGFLIKAIKLLTSGFRRNFSQNLKYKTWHSESGTKRVKKTLLILLRDKNEAKNKYEIN